MATGQRITAGYRVLLAGAAGFLGSHLADKLLAAGCQVIGMDNLQTGHLRNIDHLKGNSDFSFITHDVADPLVLDASIDVIFNLACPASPVHYQSDPVKTLRTSVYGAMNLLELAQKKGATYVQASTSEVYGDPLVHPQTESYWGHVNPVGIRSCYDEGKRAAESLCFDFRRSRSVDVRVARIFNTYGPRMDPLDGRVVSNFIVQALEGKPITIYGEGLQTRSFCYVDDLINGLFALAGTPAEVSGPVNIGNPNEFTIAELADMVIMMTGSSSAITRLPLPEDDPRQRKPDISLAWKALHWRPQVELKQGLERTIAYFKTLIAQSGTSA